ncbi:MAG: hypothetical protein B6I28_02345 [Fusobacteriia bacterium 4572_132]|nr:MAG: hypothetical protein B6I28_02345 [Fusobacteriia bacterium 4572_132]
MKKILVIDDEPTIRILLNEILEDWGYEFVGTARAQDGIDIIKKGGIDLLLLDIQLPQMNGLDAIQKIREIDKKLPVLIISAFHNMKNVVEMLEAKTQGFVNKPFDMKELKSKLEFELGGK